jgi:hypothetical protein
VFVLVADASCTTTRHRGHSRTNDKYLLLVRPRIHGVSYYLPAPLIAIPLLIAFAFHSLSTIVSIMVVDRPPDWMPDLTTQPPRRTRHPSSSAPASHTSRSSFPARSHTEDSSEDEAGSEDGSCYVPVHNTETSTLLHLQQSLISTKVRTGSLTLQLQLNSLDNLYLCSTGN